MSDEELAVAVDFIKGLYRLAREIRDLLRDGKVDARPVHAALPLDEGEGLPEPGGIARAIASAPRKWGNSVKWYEAAWREFGTRAFCLGDTFARSSLSAATNGKCGVASYQRILSALIKAGAAQRVGRSTFYLHEPTDEIRAAVEDARKGRRTA